MISLYNSLSKKKEVFNPLKPGKVSLYVCGVTVYDYCHIGHARTYVAFDMITRYFRHMGYTVDYVRNITDIDDKIIRRAREQKRSPEEIAEEYTDLMHQHFDALRILRPSQEPRATQHISHMIDLIQSLIDQGFAYILKEDVYFRVLKFKPYGALSGQDLEALHSGNRVDINDQKEDPLDFALWKAAKPEEPFWDTPWGRGRPGWHIECSAMTKACLGKTFDIHAGGSDLRFPHHENEIAQSEAANNCHYARYWMHSGMVQINHEKMSKSLGNFFTIADVLAQYPAEVIRCFLLSAHYRSEIHYTDENLKMAEALLMRFYTTLRGMDCSKLSSDEPFTTAFYAAMNDDFNTPIAWTVLTDCSKTINRLKETNIREASALSGTLKHLLSIFGLCQEDPEIFLKGQTQVQDAAWIEQCIQARAIAKKERNFQEADRIRDELLAQQIILEDSPKGTTWRQNKKT